MRGKGVTQTAIYAALVSTVAFLVSLSLLAVPAVREAETELAQVCDQPGLDARSATPANAAEPPRQRGDAAGPAAFRRLREGAVMIGLGGAVAGLLLLVPIRGSFVAHQVRTREVDRAAAIPQASAKASMEDLQRTVGTLRRHAVQVDAAVEAERARIAYDIHDDLGSTLTALKIELSGALTCGAEAGRRPLVRRASTDMVDAAMESVRRLIAELHPYPLERAGLWGGLLWKAGEFEKSIGIPCRVDMSEDLPQLSKEISIAVFRIVGEALTNVARHARATEVRIVVRCVTGKLVVEVTDDGCGMSDGVASKGDSSYGLSGMRERARAVDGELDLVARAHHGTTVRFSVRAESLAVQPLLQAEAS